MTARRHLYFSTWIICLYSYKYDTSTLKWQTSLQSSYHFAYLSLQITISGASLVLNHYFIWIQHPSFHCSNEPVVLLYQFTFLNYFKIMHDSLCSNILHKSYPSYIFIYYTIKIFIYNCTHHNMMQNWGWSNFTAFSLSVYSLIFSL